MLGIGGLAGDVVSRMIERTRLSPHAVGITSPDVKFALSGCHDTTLAAFLTSLGAFPNEPWPPYTSHIAIELFKRHDAATPAALPDLTTKTGWWASLFGSAKVAEPSPRAPISELSDVEKQKLDGYYVRLRYNDRIMSVPGCRPAGKHYADDESMCTLAAFKSIVDKFTPKNWKTACGDRLGADAFPESIEPAGV